MLEPLFNKAAVMKKTMFSIKFRKKRLWNGLFLAFKEMTLAHKEFVKKLKRLSNGRQTE